MTVVSALQWVGCTGKKALSKRCLQLRINRFAYAVIAADELTAVSNTIDFRYDDGKSFLSWTTGQNIDPAVWITLFLALVIIINMFPVKVGGNEMQE